MMNDQPEQTTGVITETDCYLYGEGTHYELYDKLGAHPASCDQQQGYRFAVWAPHAVSVSLTGDFNNWNIHTHPMARLGSSGIYEIFVPGLGDGELYKFAILTKTGELLYKADPFAFYAELRPATASITVSLKGFKWADSHWLERRKKTDLTTSPISVYEVHLGSWKKHPASGQDGFYNYREAACQLASYVKKMGYTHIELMGIAEHPFDGSWGYQVTGYYAPTSRYGTPKDFMYFIDYMHSQEIGVFLDWVPAHFPKDEHGLANFDGQPLYEYADPRKGEHLDWGTKIFDYSKYEVANFLIANALFWIKQYHIDGLRVDAVTSMLYLDYGKRDGEWVPNIYGDNKNLEAIEFFRHLNKAVHLRGDGAVMIAEESTAWPKVTGPAAQGGLGFDFKWNMGWMHDFLEFLKLDPYFRKYHHHKLTFAMTYAASEQFMLVLSHDEVVHLKCSMIEKMPGNPKDKFANLKTAYTFMIGHPGKKLLFMGQDFGQFHEWNEQVQLDWHLTQEPENRLLQNYVGDLLHLYRSAPALYSLDYSWDGFQWINADDLERSIYSFVRHDDLGRQHLLFICSFTPSAYPNYRIGVPASGNYQLLLDETCGSYPIKERPVYSAEKISCDGQPFSFAYPLPPYGAVIFSF